MIEVLGWSLTGLAIVGLAIAAAPTPQRAQLLKSAPPILAVGLALLWVSGAWEHISDRLGRSRMTPTAQASQDAFLRVIADGRQEWRAAPNEIQREPLPAARATALCALPTTVTGWQGRVGHVGRYLGSRSISLSLTITGSDVTLRTEGDLQDLNTKIQPSTPLFDAVSQLGEGARVTFSGEFIPDAKTRHHETSLTNYGLMTAPTFLFRFTAVAPDR